jgi:transposase InsO family protein
MKALLDSGAQSNYITTRAATQAKLTTTKKRQPYLLTVASGDKMPGQREVDKETTPAFMEIEGHTESISMDILCEATHDIILGLPWLRKHNPRIDWKKQTLSLVNCNSTCNRQPTHSKSRMVDEKTIHLIASKTDAPQTRVVASAHPTKRDTLKGVEEKRATPEVPREYDKWSHLFKEETDERALPKHQPWDHEITLQEGKQPGFGPIYALSEKELQTLRKYIDENLKKGFIRESKSPAGYPILFVPKKDGTLRPCIDYRKLNDITIKNRYPLPNISELQDRLAHAKYFTALDLRGAYNLIRMKKGEEWKTAFRTRYGHYEYLVMPFGLTNAPATCQELINNVLRTHLDIFVIAYLDDILIYSNNIADHVEHVKTILTCLDQAGLRLKPEKCEFHKQEVEFLGFRVGVDGVKMSPSKIQAVQDWPTPQNVKNIQEFLGFSNFNRRFIENYARKALPLTKLTRKDETWEWSTKQQQAFEELKQAQLEPPVLIAFRTNEPMRMETDASDTCLGACITQLRDGHWKPIAYYSRKFTPTEERYDVHDKELLAIVSAMKHWRIYAESCSELTIYTDHKNLTFFTTTKTLNRRQVRWSEELGQYKFRIVYTPGRENGRADALSRRADLAGAKTQVDSTILRLNEDGSLGPAQQLNAMLHITIPVPEELQEAIIQQHHDDALHGHQGIKRTIELIQRNYDIPGLKEKVTQYINRCSDCQKNKHSTHTKYGESQPIWIPQAPWEDISMDFVTGLPESKDPVTRTSYNAILVVVDRFTKYAELIPFHKNYSAEQLGYVILDRIIRYHGIPKTIISDRDKLFTSNYWTTLMATIGTKRKLSTAYHPETDGQTERTNRTIETYLRIYGNQQQSNWISLLPMAQLVYNNKLSESTQTTPYYANHGKHPNLFERTFPTLKTEKALQTADEMKKTHKQLQQNLQRAQQNMISYANKKRKMAPQLKKGDKVYLLTKNLRTTRPSKKLDHVKVGPFLISERISPVNYQLQLPQDAKIHPVFHISLLEPAHEETPLQNTFHYEVEEDNEYEVERIVDHRGTPNECEYLVKWKGYPETENTWEPSRNLNNCKELLLRYWK